jgi:hypothetical protein
LRIPDDFFTDEQRNKLKTLFGAEDDARFRDALNQVVLAALDEYRDMFLGMGLPSRASEIREFRLYYLIKRFFGGKIPDELEVARMFQLPHARARNLILYVLTRFRFNLSAEILDTLHDIIEGAEHLKEDGGEEYRVFIGSENMVDELNRIITSSGGYRYNQLTKMRGESNKYSIPVDSYDVIANYLGLKKRKR